MLKSGVETGLNQSRSGVVVDASRAHEDAECYPYSPFRLRLVETLGRASRVDPDLEASNAKPSTPAQFLHDVDDAVE
ncbi:MAG TPA: hypothetical protein VEK07_15385 [Polyangiaceae bacterium]|nr:hypothetical protein [Polyangiaceae bacterium]